AGETTAMITVPTIDDGLVEDSESLRVDRKSVAEEKSIALSATTVARETIDDNDSATDSISDTRTVTHGGDLNFTVMLSSASRTVSHAADSMLTDVGDQIVMYTLRALNSTENTIIFSLGGPATGLNDYRNSTVGAPDPAGETMAMITVPTIDDGLVEGSESLT